MGFGDASLLALCAVLYVVCTDSAGVHHPRVLTGKCRVTPLMGTTVPRGELQALVMVHRLLLTVAEAFPYRFNMISAFTDSMCSVGALHKSPSSLRPYFCNRVLEINRIREQLGELCGGLPPICHIPGENNPADLGTRGQVSMGDLGPGSTWQLGPGFLQADFSEWLSSVDVDVAQLQLPPEECKQPAGSTFHVGTVQMQEPLQILVDQVGMETKLGVALRQMAKEALTREKLEMLTRALARALQAVLAGDREVCRKPPLTKMLEIAVRLLVRIASKPFVVALQAGKLRGLGAEGPRLSSLGNGKSPRGAAGCAAKHDCSPSVDVQRTSSLGCDVKGAPGGPQKGTPGRSS